MTRILSVAGAICAVGFSGGFGLAAEAQTPCAVASDLRRGVHLDFSDGSRETYREIRPSVLSVDGSSAGEAYFRLEVAQGTHLLSYVAVSNGQLDEPSRQTYDYGMDASALPVPEAGGRFNAEVTVTASDGPRQENQLQAYVAGEPMVIGGCTYETIEVLIAYDTQDNYIESIRYFPELGLGYLVWNQSDEGRSDENILISVRNGK